MNSHLRESELRQVFQRSVPLEILLGVAAGIVGRPELGGFLETSTISGCHSQRTHFEGLSADADDKLVHGGADELAGLRHVVVAVVEDNFGCLRVDTRAPDRRCEESLKRSYSMENWESNDLPLVQMPGSRDRT